MTSVSIAMATYNGARFIGEQLESLARQTVLPAELVVTDDNSTDGTPDIIAAFAAKAPFSVRIEKNPEQLGYRRNFMKVAGLCRSDLIAFCDQDDVWLPRKLETCLAPFAAPAVLLSYHNALAVNEALQPLGTTDLQSAPQTISPPQSISPWRYGLGFTLIFRKSLMEFENLWPQSADFYKPDLPEAHDQWFFFLASCLGNIAYSADPLVLYRQHGRNTEGWKAAVGPWTRFVRLLAIDTAELIRSRKIAAEKRAGIMKQIAASHTGAIGDHAHTAASGYSQLATNYRRREDIYASPSLTHRLAILKSLYREGIYTSPAPWGFGRRELVRDILRGVLFPKKQA